MWKSTGDRATGCDGESSRRGELMEADAIGSVKTIDLTGAPRPMSQYRKEALALLQLLIANEGARRDGDRAAVGEELGARVGNVVAPAHSTVLSEIDRVMAKVDEAIEGLTDNEGNKRVKRTIEASSNEVRTLVKHIETENFGEAVEGDEWRRTMWSYSLHLNHWRSQRRGKGNVRRRSRARREV